MFPLSSLPTPEFTREVTRRVKNAIATLEEHSSELIGLEEQSLAQDSFSYWEQAGSEIEGLIETLDQEDAPLDLQGMVEIMELVDFDAAQLDAPTKKVPSLQQASLSHVCRNEEMADFSQQDERPTTPGKILRALSWDR